MLKWQHRVQHCQRKARKNTHRAPGGRRTRKTPAFAGRGRRLGEARGVESFQVPSSALKLRARARGLEGSGRSWARLGAPSERAFDRVGLVASFLPGSRSHSLSPCIQCAVALPTDSAPADGGRGAPRRLSASGLVCPGRTRHKGGGRARRRRRGEQASLALPRCARSLRAPWALGWTKQPAAFGPGSRSRAWSTSEPLPPPLRAGSIWS